MDAEGISYRPFRPGDGEGVVEVLREYYKDDYYNAACYDVDYLEKSSRDGRRVLFVAESPADGIIGVAGGNYRSYFPGSYELGLHVFKQAYQGKGIAKGLLKYCADAIERMHVFGVYGMAVSYHDRSQYECEAIGIPATGFWLGRHRADRAFFSDKPRSPKLHSVVVACPGMVRNRGPLYVPREHRAFVAGIYEKLGVPFQFACDGPCPAPAASIFVKDDADAGNREIYARSLGRDLTDRVWKLVKDAAPSDGCTVFLNMLNIGCEGACDKLRDMGFYFTGIHPLHDNNELIMLHREPAGGYVWEETVLTPTNREILDYILAHKQERTGRENA